ncbi:MAG: serine/threonine protein kinase [Deltaproteobacteria bacterium]|nr:serine/threonine protein kinase [Deltaproteobacteria bacterium]
MGAFVPGELVGDKYRVECVLAKSPHAILLAAFDEVLERGVALKLLPTVRQPRRIARFVREARAAARIESEHVVRILDVGTFEGGMPFMVLERLEGFDLGELLARDGPLPPARIADYVLQVCEGLAHAHAAGIVHRDVKPQNLFLAARADGVTVVKIVDFGIAKAGERDRENTLTGSIAVLGSPTYMSPEQIDAPKDVDGRADIWSLGVVMYRLATGTSPFAGETFQELARNVAAGAPAPFGRQGPGYADLERIVMRCLQKAPADRYPDVLALARDLTVLAPTRAAEVLPKIAFVSGTPDAVNVSEERTLPLDTQRPPGVAPPLPSGSVDLAREDARVPKGIGIAVTVVAALVVVVVAVAVLSSARARDAARAPGPPAGSGAAAPTADPPPPVIALDPAPSPPPTTTSSPHGSSSAATPRGVGRPARPRSTNAGAAAPPPGNEPLPKALGGRI